MSFPILDETDMEILMHRDVHFGGNFRIMIEYYEKGGVGINDEFSLRRIKELYTFEKELGENLSKKVLPSQHYEEIQRAKQFYLKLREVYETAPEGSLPRLISDLILSEEEEPEKEIAALVRRGPEATPTLCHLVESPDLVNPLYPGYGRAPLFAVKVLARIGDPKAIRPLFQALRFAPFEEEEAILTALGSFGDAAKTFLLDRLQRTPYSRENELAASALSSFIPDEQVESAARKLLSQEEVQKRDILVSYLECLIQ